MAKDTSKPNATAPQSRLCFVIMPFSATASCTEKQWASIFENVLKPAVENADYACHRSIATRGNIIAAILENLRDAYVVLADLTDQNPNVFYELGVRHALKNRTILIAQDEKFIPFDLRPYATYVYNGKTKRGREELATRLRELLADVDQSPDRADNPVSDFLKGRAATQASAQALTITPQEAAVAQALAGPASEGVDPLELGKTLGRSRDAAALRALARETRGFFSQEWPRLIEKLNAGVPASPRIPQDQIYEHCLPYIQRFSSDADRVEVFGLTLVEAEHEDGLAEMFRILGDWISLSQRYWPGGSLRAVTGAPALLALRALTSWGTKAADDMLLDVLGFLLTHPLETIESTGQTASLPLVDRRDLFWPEGLLGLADLAVQYLQTESWRNDGLQRMFASREDYLAGLSRFLFTAALIHDARHPDETWPLYPGFKLVEGSSRSLHTFVSRLSIRPQLMASLANMANEDLATFRAKWPERVKRLNEAQLGGRMDIRLHWDRIPEEM